MQCFFIPTRLILQIEQETWCPHADVDENVLPTMLMQKE